MTRFDRPELSRYAEEHVLADTRTGVTTLGIVSMVLLAVGALAYSTIGYDVAYAYTCGILAFFSGYIALSAHMVKQTRLLYLLGTLLLVVVATAFVLLAHRFGAFNTGLYVSVVLLFMVMPLVPWGGKEALVTISLVYGLFTASTLSVHGRFDARTLWLLQFLMAAGALVTLTVIARAVDVRKNDIRLRFELEKARKEMELLSNKDPLTGTWNRRYLDSHSEALMAKLKQEGGQMIHFGLLDVDKFKQINDSYGHGFGDLVLRKLVDAIKNAMGRNGYIFRIGGDEFALLVRHDDPDRMVEEAVDRLNGDAEVQAQGQGHAIDVSCGFLPLSNCDCSALEDVYSDVDKLMYEKKYKKRDATSPEAGPATVAGGRCRAAR